MATTTRPTAAHSLVYLALVRELKGHPATRGLVRTWKTWEGQAKDDDSFAETALPGVRLTPIALPSVRHTRASIAEPIRVLVETAVKGRDFAGAAELWNRLDRALFRVGEAETRRLWAAVQATGASELVPEQPALPESAEAYGGAMVVSRGSFLIRIYTRTR